MSAEAVAGYRALLELTEREHALVCAEQWDAHEQLIAERDALVRGLPEQPPAAARALLARSAAVQAETSRCLEALSLRVDADLARLEQARRVARGYGGHGAVNQYVDRSG